MACCSCSRHKQSSVAHDHACVCLACRIVLVAVGSLVGSVALRPNTPLVALVIGTLIIVGTALVVDAAYARGWLPASLVHARPILLYADGEREASCLGGNPELVPAGDEQVQAACTYCYVWAIKCLFL